MNNNVVSWFDVPTLDFDRAVKFYSAILGKDVMVSEHMGQKLGFFPMPIDPKGPGAGGDIMLPNPNYVPSGNGTRIYLNCEGRLDAALERVSSSGGRVIQEKFYIGEPGWIAVIEDTEGNTIGLHSAS